MVQAVYWVAAAAVVGQIPTAVAQGRPDKATLAEVVLGMVAASRGAVEEAAHQGPAERTQAAMAQATR